jgi:hypothetical protein
MGDKERPGKKAIRLPSILFTKWKTEVVDKHGSLLSQHSDKPLVVTLTGLFHGQDQPWEKQSALLKQTGNV